jgi:hypothetical protein
MTFYESIMGLMTISLFIAPVIAYFAHKNEWKITKYF